MHKKQRLFALKQDIVTHKIFIVSLSHGMMAAPPAALANSPRIVVVMVGHGARQRHNFGHCHLEDKTSQKSPETGGPGSPHLKPENIVVYCSKSGSLRRRNPFPTNMERLKT